jgi:PAS domain S-box-containing protein
MLTMDNSGKPQGAATGPAFQTPMPPVDTSAWTKAEAELARERDLLRTLLDYSPDYIYFKDTDSRFLRCSRSLAERFGLKAEELIGKTDFDLYGEAHARPAFDDEQRIIRTGEPVIGKIEREVWKQGEVKWVLTSKMPLTNKAGETIGTFGLTKDITAIKEAEAKLEVAHKQLLETSRMAGMAEVATSVLHNVGNVLNSVNVSCSVVSDKIRSSKVSGLGRVAALLTEHQQDLPGFFSNDPKGAQLPSYLTALAGHLQLERDEVLKELALLSANIDHIKEIVAMQQSYSKVSGVRESLPARDLLEDALRMNAAAMDRHQIEVVRDYADTPPIVVERHKVLQILVNLIRNAKYACDDVGHADKKIIARTRLVDGNRVQMQIIDNGIGIPAENLTRVFEHGFTTRREGHGFGLHSGALAAREMGGSLVVHSDGAGTGATFTLELPCSVPEVVI